MFGESEHLALVITEKGGHLGWCDSGDSGACAWVEEAALDFISAALDIRVKIRPLVRGVDVDDITVAERTTTTTST